MNKDKFLAVALAVGAAFAMIMFLVEQVGGK